MRACLLAALPSKAFLPLCERDARAPSTRNAGNAGIPPAMPTAREKTCPFKRGGRGGLWSAEAELPPTLKLALQHFKHVRARLPSPTQWERGWG